MTDIDYSDDLVFPTNTYVNMEEEAAGGIGFYLSTNNIKLISFKQKGPISAFRCKPLKSVDQFTLFGFIILSTENNVNIRLGKD